MEKFLELYDHHFPLKEFTRKENHINKPYITQAIKTSIKRRNKLQKLYAKWPLTYGKTFTLYRNTLTSMIRSAKENYYKSKLKENTGNTKKTWDIIKPLWGKVVKKCQVLFPFRIIRHVATKKEQNHLMNIFPILQTGSQ